MRQQALGFMVGLLLAAATGAAQASQVVENRMLPASALTSCDRPAENQPDAVTERQELLEQYEALPQHCLKAIVIVCSQAAGTGLLDLGHAAACSIGYEALLKRGFGGDFKAMLAWWRTQRDGSTVN